MGRYLSMTLSMNQVVCIAIKPLYKLHLVTQAQASTHATRRTTASGPKLVAHDRKHTSDSLLQGGRELIWGLWVREFEFQVADGAPGV